MTYGRFRSVVLLLAAVPAWADIAPARLEANLGPIPVDLYTSQNLEPGTTNVALLTACRDGSGTPQTGWTVRDCVRSMVGDITVNGYYNPNNYRRQGVRGIRFLFAVGGGFHSAAFDAQGNVQSQWRASIRSFFDDLRSLGIETVSPSPVLKVSWTVNRTENQFNPAYVVVPCGGLGLSDPYSMGCTPGNTDPAVIGATGQPLRFYKWLNFGFIHGPICLSQTGCDDGLWDGFQLNQAYNNAPANPYFWGWYDEASLQYPAGTQKYMVGLFNAVLYEAKMAGLTVADLDIETETSLDSSTVLARMLFDNMTNTPVYSRIHQLMAERGHPAGRATMSTGLQRPTTEGWTCESDYENPGGLRDSAFLQSQSALEAAIAWSHFGDPKADYRLYVDGLWCFQPNQCQPGNDLCRYGDMPETLVAQPAPTITNVHTHVCVADALGACDDRKNSESTAKNVYDAVWKFISDRSQQGSQYVVFGETNTNQSLGCDDSTPVQALRNVNGFRASALYTNRQYQNGDLTVFRPWANAADPTGCYWVRHPLTPYIADGPPTAVTVAPYESIAQNGVSTFAFTDPNGYTDLKTADVNISAGWARSDASSCWIQYDRAANLLRLRHDNGTTWLPTTVRPDTLDSVSNSQCTLSGTGSWVSTPVVTRMDLSLNLSFTAAFTGTKRVYLQCADNALGNPTRAVTTVWRPRGFIGGNPSVAVRANDTAGLWVAEFGPLAPRPILYWYSSGGFPLTPGFNNPGAAQNRGGDTVVALVDNNGALRVNAFSRASSSWGSWAAPAGRCLRAILR